MSYQKIVDEFVTSQNVIDMFMLAKMTNDFICEVEEIKPEMVEKFRMKLEMYMHPFKDREKAEYAVSKFKNDDGSTGEHWDYETTSRLAEKYEIDKKPVFYYVLNMMYSDQYESGKSDMTYVKEAIKWMDDKDAPEDKAERYYRAMNYAC